MSRGNVRADREGVRAVLGQMLGRIWPFQIQMLGLLGLIVVSTHKNIDKKNGEKNRELGVMALTALTLTEVASCPF